MGTTFATHKSYGKFTCNFIMISVKMVNLKENREIGNDHQYDNKFVFKKTYASALVAIFIMHTVEICIQ